MKRFKRIGLLGFVLVSSILLNGCKIEDDTIDYFGQKPPGDKPVIFAPGVISLEGRFERVPAFSPDGKELFFTVTTPDWAPTIMYSKNENGSWSAPDIAFFSKVYNNTEPIFSPDGNRLYFASNRPPGSPPWNGDLWMTERTEGGWSEPKHLGPEVNSNTSDYHPTVTNDGTLYFASARDAERSGPDIYRSRLIDGRYQSPERLGESVNSNHQEWDPYVTPDESLIIFKSDRPGGFGDMDLYISFKTEDGSWTAAKNMGPNINTNDHDDAGDISPDGKFLFFARRTGAHEMDIYWVDIKVIQDMRPEK